MTTDAELPRLQVRDPHVMRALAHPARFAIMDHLMTGAETTATECAEVCGLSPSATSYHLRALARAGLVEEAPSRGDGRERVWRSSVRGFNVDSDLDDDPEAWAAGRDLVNVLLDRQDAQVRAWIDRSKSEPKDWRDATTVSEGRLLVTADELAAINKTIQELIEPYHFNRRRDNPPPGSRRVAVAYRSYPTD